MVRNVGGDTPESFRSKCSPNRAECASISTYRFYWAPKCWASDCTLAGCRAPSNAMRFVCANWIHLGWQRWGSHAGSSDDKSWWKCCSACVFSFLSRWPGRVCRTKSFGTSFCWESFSRKFVWCGPFAMLGKPETNRTRQFSGNSLVEVVHTYPSIHDLVNKWTFACIRNADDGYFYQFPCRIGIIWGGCYVWYAWFSFRWNGRALLLILAVRYVAVKSILADACRLQCLFVIWKSQRQTPKGKAQQCRLHLNKWF